MSRFLLLITFFSLSVHVAVSQNPKDLAVPIHISAGINPPAVFLTWENPVPSDVILRRRIKGQAGNTWIELINAPETLLDGHFDLGLSGDETYEYALERKTGGVTAYGFAFANFFTPIVDKRGKILIFIDSTTADQLGADLITFKNDLRGEGWQTVPIKTGNSTTVQWVKNQIVSAYNADPSNVKAVLLLGNTPFPIPAAMPGMENRTTRAPGPAMPITAILTVYGPIIRSTLPILAVWRIEMCQVMANLTKINCLLPWNLW